MKKLVLYLISSISVYSSQTDEGALISWETSRQISENKGIAGSSAIGKTVIYWDGVKLGSGVNMGTDLL